MNGIEIEQGDKKEEKYIAEIPKGDLYTELSLYDVISFDMFDTLVMRRCIYPEVVFRFVEKKIKDCWNFEESFCEVRKRTEKKIYHAGNIFFNLNDIYEEIKRECQIETDFAELIKQEELKTEYLMVVPRKEIVECLKKLQLNKKKIVITTDMYLSSEQLKYLLKKIGIENVEILVSNEVKGSKYLGNLFDCLLECYPQQNIIHVGDNYLSDIQNAKEKGIKTCFVGNAVNFLEYYQFNLGNLNDLNLLDKYIVGKFLNKCFEELNKATKLQNKIRIKKRKMFGYLFLGPIAVGYMSWLVQQIKNENITHMLFFFAGWLFVL